MLSAKAKHLVVGSGTPVFYHVEASPELAEAISTKLATAAKDTRIKKRRGPRDTGAGIGLPV